MTQIQSAYDLFHHTQNMPDISYESTKSELWDALLVLQDMYYSVFVYAQGRCNEVERLEKIINPPEPSAEAPPF